MTLAFDVGGTWTRVCSVDPHGAIAGLSRRRTPGLGAAPDPVAALCDLVLEVTDARDAERAVISLGAAIDHRSGEVLGSGPLWGGRNVSFNLENELALRRPLVEWRVWNDVTALAAQIASLPEVKHLRRVAAVTVSSGIAERVIDPLTRRVDTGAHHGLQGEIGHLPAVCLLDDEPVHRRCACGGVDHLSSFASGLALQEITRDRLGGRVRGVAGLARAVRAGDPAAIDVFDATLRPLAAVLLCQLAVDPAVEKVVLAGGVVDVFGDLYSTHLLHVMDALGLYGVTSRAPQALHELILAAPAKDDRCLLGAVSLAGWGVN